MKILCIIPSYVPAFRYGGPIASVHGLNKWLVKKGIHVTVYTTNSYMEDNASIAFNEESDVDGVKVYYFKYYFFKRFVFSPSFLLHLKKHIKEYDVIHLNGIWTFMNLAAYRYATKNRIPYIFTVRGSLYPYTFRKKGWKKKPYYYLVTRRELTLASAVHYTTEDEREQVCNFLNLKNKAYVIPNMMDFEMFKTLPPRGEFRKRYDISKQKKIVVFLGRINWEKGLDILSRAFGSIAVNRDDILLLVIGPDNEGYAESIKKILEEERVLDKVIFTGMLTGRDKLSALVDSDVFVLPSYSENFGMSVIEAMTVGVPIVISDKVGISKLVSDHHAGIVVKCEVESLERGIAETLNNKNLVSETVQNGKNLVEQHLNPDIIGNRMISFYEEMLLTR